MSSVTIDRLGLGRVLPSWTRIQCSSGFQIFQRTWITGWPSSMYRECLLLVFRILAILNSVQVYFHWLFIKRKILNSLCLLLLTFTIIVTFTSVSDSPYVSSLMWLWTHSFKKFNDVHLFVISGIWLFLGHVEFWLYAGQYGEGLIDHQTSRLHMFHFVRSLDKSEWNCYTKTVIWLVWTLL